VLRAIFAGDLMDYGTESSSIEFEEHVARFHHMFATPVSTDMQVLVGNHDVGFHYM